ncbi:cytochrome c-type biogenesis protein CcmH [Marinobacter pelagius]|uniref:Cytochrome c-type biogenesis protein n=1 Tax=Marinobacter pelagius TaxID=379482 RepID=A0A366GRJ4_9GAMM|nr:cytochrome c-type biogenesis protein CcmH [Marinobacter pelagius]
MMRFILAALFALTAGLVQAEVAAVYDFDTREQEVRYQNLIAELRCPKCQNQNIADSNAPISQDMRNEVYEMMQAGASNEEIVDALVARFGEFVRYKPELDSRTFLLWATPAIAVFGGLLVVAGVVIRARRVERQAAGLSAEERARAEQILKGQDNTSDS